MFNSLISRELAELGGEVQMTDVPVMVEAEVYWSPGEGGEPSGYVVEGLSAKNRDNKVEALSSQEIESFREDAINIYMRNA